VVVNEASAFNSFAARFLRKRQPLTTPAKSGVLFWKVHMSNEKLTAPFGKTIASVQSYDTKKMDSDTRGAISSLREEMHEMLQLPPEDLAKIDHIDLHLLTARLFPKS
jgi:hypothetical protein